MPELPEVEVHRRHLHAWVEGRTVVDLALRPAGLLKGTTQASLRRFLQGAYLGVPARTGKHLLIPTQRQASLYIHLGMTGHLSCRLSTAPAPRFPVLALSLDNHTTVDLTDARRFSRLGVVADDEVATSPLSGLGADLLDHPPTPAQLVALLARVRKPLKTALMDQDRVAGLGNIHAAEALWRARLSPVMPAQKLTTTQARALLKGIRETFNLVLLEDDGAGVKYVEQPGNPNPFLVYARDGEPCPRCGESIHKVTQAGRTTYFCPACQRP